jgi:hypothetical protein
MRKKNKIKTIKKMRGGLLGDLFRANRIGTKLITRGKYAGKIKIIG